MDLKLGFSTGVFKDSNLDLFTRLELIWRLNCRILELGYIRLDEFFLQDIQQLSAAHFEKFEYVSLHAPKNDYGNNEKTKKIFEKIKIIHGIRNLNSVVFHPDNVVDIGVFHKAGFPIAFENMDSRNQAYKTPDELIPMLNENNNFEMVLDLNHAYSNDPTMALAAEFCEKLGRKIAHVHLSGYKSRRIADRHVPLFQTKQVEIIRAIRNLNQPIIIESMVSPEEAPEEYNYILQIIAGNISVAA